MLRRAILLELALVVSMCAQQNTPVQPARSGFRIAGTAVSAIGGQNLAEAQITIVDVKRPSFSETMVTGDDGRFHFENLAAGKYLLAGSRTGYSQQSFDQHFQFSTAIAVGAGLDSTEMVFRLRPDAKIAGTVVDDENEAVRNADVMLFQQGTQTGDAEITRVKDASTDDRGHYLFGQLQAGTYFVVVSAQPWYAKPPVQRYRILRSQNGQTRTELIDSTDETGPLDVAYPITYYPGVTDASAATPLVLKAGDRVEADLSLAPVAAVHFRIYTGSDMTAGVGANLTKNVF
ncbi:MAG TPA: carboxypeptidase-like regulatory domain-containing protein, partial [Candidatus Acidoferrales bacterium]|nr:carboxypeptidase-like regulatory domain-containing protein [Candidatus Acidoferrales bacterium]